jgi:hypothetical protein
MMPSDASRISSTQPSASLLLDLRDQRRRGAEARDELAHAPHVVGAAHEREGRVVDAVRDAEREILAVLLGQGGGRRRSGREG